MLDVFGDELAGGVAGVLVLAVEPQLRAPAVGVPAVVEGGGVCLPDAAVLDGAAGGAAEQVEGFGRTVEA